MVIDSISEIGDLFERLQATARAEHALALTHLRKERDDAVEENRRLSWALYRVRGVAGVLLGSLAFVTASLTGDSKLTARSVTDIAERDLNAVNDILDGKDVTEYTETSYGS